MGPLISFSKPLLLALCLLGYVLAAHRVFKVRPYATPLWAFCFILCSLYLFALLGLLRPAAMFLLASGLVLAVSELWQMKDRLKVGTNWRVLGANAFAVCVLLAPALYCYLKIPADYYFFRNDEYSHWALSTKVIAATDGIFRSDSGVAFKSYPPGTALFHYFWVRLLGYSEATVLMAHIVLILAAMAAAFAPILERRPLVGALLYSAALVCAYAFGYELYSIYVDLILGAVFAAALSTCFGTRFSRSGLATVVLLSSALILIKSIGLVLALIVWATYLLPRIFRGIARLSANIRLRGARSGWRYGRVLSRTALLHSCAAALPLAVFFSWKSYVSLIGDKVVRDLPDLSAFFASQCGRVYLLLRELGTRIHEPLIKFSAGEQEFGASIATATAMLIFGSLMTVALMPAGRRPRAVWILSACTIGGCLYVGFLLYSYIAFFSFYEAVRLASFERYIGTYHFAWLLVVCGTLLDAVMTRGRPRSALMLAAFFVAFGIAFAPKQLRLDLSGPPSDIGNRDLRNKVKRLADLALLHAKPGDSAYYIGQASKGYDFLMFRHLAAPLSRGQYWCWSIGELYYEGDVWTCGDELAGLVKGYQILVLGHADQQFWKAHQQMFREEDRLLEHGVFAIQRSADGGLSFSLIGR